MDTKTWALILGAFLTVTGWIVSHHLTSRREDKTRRLEAAFRYSERQIEELYGPVLSLVEQIFIVWNIRERLLEDPETPERQKQLLFFQTEYFFPLHDRIREILACKLHLVERGTVPESFRKYLEHSMQQRIQYQLETVIEESTTGEDPDQLSNRAEAPDSTAKVADIPWPGHFEGDLKKDLKDIQVRAGRYRRDLDPGDADRRDAVTAGAADSRT